MLHAERIVFDIAGEERQGLEVKNLLALFERNAGEELLDDSLLLGEPFATRPIDFGL